MISNVFTPGPHEMADDTRVTHSRSGLACALALVSALGLLVPAQAFAGNLIVRREAGLTASERADIRADAGVRLERMLPVPHTEVVTVPDSREDEALAALKADPDVRLVARDVPVRVAGEDQDQYQYLQWALHNGGPRDGLPNAVMHSDIDADEAWEISTGGGIVVGVVDMSVWADHPDFVEHVVAEPGPPYDEPHVEEGANFVETPSGCPAPEGPADHGTHVAGTIVAARNGIGIVGVAPDAHAMPLRALDDCGTGSLETVIAALEFAGAEGLPIVVTSLSTDPWLAADDKADVNAMLASVIKRYEDQTLFVAAAGNHGNDNDDKPVYPCATTVDGEKPPNLLCVGMTDASDAPVCSGNVGKRTVDLFAPGFRIYSTVRGVLGWTVRDGTSQAAPMVAGAAALVMAQNPHLSPAQVADQLRNSVSAKDALRDISVAGGRLNAAQALDFQGKTDPEGGDGPAWKTCDRDHDQVLDAGDQCPDTPGTLSGCPDSDSDGVRDLDDNCPAVSNPNQADMDGDRIGDACDDDVDGDLRATLVDRCPTVHALTPDGCPIVSPPAPGPQPTPTPVPPPVISSVEPARIFDVDIAVVKRCTRSKGCKKSAKVTVRVTRTARVTVRVERRVRKNKTRKAHWSRVISRSLKATTRGRTMTVRGRRGRTLARGSYRVTVKLPGARTVKRTFKV